MNCGEVRRLVLVCLSQPRIRVGYRLDRFPSVVLSRLGSEICMTKIGANANGSSIIALANRELSAEK